MLQSLKLAAYALKTGHIVMYPTESFWALGVDATNHEAIRQLFRVKHREWGKPFAVIAADLKQVEKFFFLSPAECRLAAKYWPGPLTILLRPKAPSYSNVPKARRRGIAARALGASLIGVRIPAHGLARQLAKHAGVPLTATSANVTSLRPTKSIVQVRRIFPGILTVPGQCGRQRRPSTVVRCDGDHISILRFGSIHV